MPDKRKPSISASGASPNAKRSRGSHAAEEDEEGAPQAVTPYERPRHHPVFGQKSAIPGLDIAGDDELFYGPAEDGLEYLRMVRSEANSLPLLLVAPPVATSNAVATKNTNPGDDTAKSAESSHTQSATSDAAAAETSTNTTTNATTTTPLRPFPLEGIYRDGVYFATASNKNNNNSSTLSVTPSQPSDPEVLPAQSTYYTLLHHRFLLLRSILKCTPPSDAIAALGDDHPITLPLQSWYARRVWRRLLLEVDPLTVQLACMEMDCVLGVLGILGRVLSENVRSGDEARVRRIAAWAWGLLGRCREVGQLGTEEVGELRDLGKRAVRVLGKIREEEEEGNKDDAEDEGGEREGEDGDNGIEVDLEMRDADGDADAGAEADAPQAEADELEAAKARLQAKIDGGDGAADEAQNEHTDEQTGGASEVTLQIRAMLDMIITIVGEYYGQLDLLKAREVWREVTK